MMEMWNLQPTYPVNQITANFIMNPKPPTLYAILNSIANYDKEEKTKIRNLAKVCHSKIFDFDYTLSSALDKDQFEIDILNHFLMRRIGFDTVTAFQLYLENKLHEILPYYNLMLDAFKDYNLFDSGELIERDEIDDRNINSNSNSNITANNTSDNRFSEYPMDQLDDIKNGKYVTNQQYNINDSTSDTAMNSMSNDNNTIRETIKRSPVDKMTIYKSYLDTKNSVMSKIYKELDSLFYQLAD